MSREECASLVRRKRKLLGMAELWEIRDTARAAAASSPCTNVQLTRFTVISINIHSTTVDGNTLVGCNNVEAF